MNARRRYDTTALIQDLKTDRRKGLGLTLAAAVVILVLVGVYISQIGGGTPEVPENATPVQPSAEEKQAALDAAIEDPEREAEAAPEPPPPPPKATVELDLPRKGGELWVDGESVGKVKAHVAELEAGEHTFKVKMGRRTIEHTETLAPGSKVELSLNLRKKKMRAKIVEPGVEPEAAPADEAGEAATGEPSPDGPSEKE